MDLPLIAQVAGESINQGPQWVGTGLLGGVLGWLLFVYLPAKDKQLKEMTDNHNASLKDLWDKKSTAIRELASASQKSIETVVNSAQKTVDASNTHCQKELEKIADTFKYELDRVFPLLIKRDAEYREYKANRDTEQTKTDLRQDRGGPI